MPGDKKTVTAIDPASRTTANKACGIKSGQKGNAQQQALRNWMEKNVPADIVSSIAAGKSEMKQKSRLM